MMLKATIKNLNEVFALKQKTLDYIYPGFSWSKDYPTKETFKNDIDKGELYLFYKQGSLIRAPAPLASSGTLASTRIDAR